MRPDSSRRGSLTSRLSRATSASTTRALMAIMGMAKERVLLRMRSWMRVASRSMRHTRLPSWPETWIGYHQLRVASDPSPVAIGSKSVTPAAARRSCSVCVAEVERPSDAVPSAPVTATRQVDVPVFGTSRTVRCRARSWSHMNCILSRTRARPPGCAVGSRSSYVAPSRVD